MKPKRFRALAGRLAAATTALLLLTAGTALAVTPPTFVAPSTADAVGVLPRDVAVGDFDGDGNQDTAVANDGPAAVFSGGIAVSLGDGQGHLGAPTVTTLPQDWGAGAVAAGDFDADGAADLITLASTTGGPGPLFPLMGAGDGTFDVGSQLVGPGEGQLVTADFDGNGTVDFAFSANGVAKVKVYLGNGDGTFAAPESYTPTFDSYEVAVADLNLDGATDIVGASGGSPWALLNDGAGHFPESVYSFDTRLMGIGLTLPDLNADGLADIAMVDASGGHVSVGLGTGDGHFTAFKRYGGMGMQTNYVTSGDVTGDGRPDVVANGDSNTSALLRGAGDGSLMPAIRFGTGSMFLTAADLNGDSFADLVALTQDPGETHATLGAGTQGFLAPRLTTGRLGGVTRIGDVNGDGRQDVVLGGGVIDGNIKSVIATHLGRPGGQFAKAKLSLVRVESASSGIGDIQLADVNQDGKLDVVGGFTNFMFSPNNLFVMLGLGNGGFAAPTLFNSGDANADVVSVAVADVTGDGVLDIVSHTLSKVSVKPGNGDGTFGPAIVSGVSGPSQDLVIVADVTGDGIPDVVDVQTTGGEDFSSSDIMLEEGHGDGTFSLVQTRSVDTNTADGGSADFDGDGLTDMALVGGAGSNGGRGGLWVALADGSGRLAPPTYYPRGWTGFAVGDYNLDGSPDIATDITNAVALSLNAGGSFGEFTTVLSIGTAAAAADFTSDGKPDLVVGVAMFPPAFALYVNSTA